MIYELSRTSLLLVMIPTNFYFYISIFIRLCQPNNIEYRETALFLMRSGLLSLRKIANSFRDEICGVERR